MAQAMPQAGEAERLLILVDETEPRTLGVRAIELSMNAVRVRFASTTVQGLDQAFQQEVAGIIRSICDGAAHALGVLERPDFCLRIRGLTLEGYTIAVSVGDNGMRCFRLQINRAMGNALAIFRLSARTDTGLSLFNPRIISGPEEQIGSERLFDEMLSQLYLPLVNLNAYLRNVLDCSHPDQGESLSNSVVQLKTRAETLQFAFDRLIADMMVDKYTTEQPETPMTAA